MLAKVEGMTPFDTVVKGTLAYGLMPCVVPELKSITVGGAISGVGIESSSFKYGFVHETVEEMEILLSNGDIVACSKDGDHSDLFFAIPNSYGTLGYIVSAVIKLIPVTPYIKLTHRRYSDINEYFTALKNYTVGNHDFIDGVVFSEKEIYLTLADFTESAEHISNYTYMDIYYKSIQKRDTDYLSIYDYIWRWDTDWFWCSRVFGLQNPVLRFLLGKSVLNSLFYLKLGRINRRIKFTPLLTKLMNIKTESIIQDVEIPVENAAEYLKFQLREIPIRPVWVCPMKSSSFKFDLYRTEPDTLYVNFGFWQIIKTKKPAGYYNKLIEKRVSELGGIKSLYSESYYTEKEFWEIYNKEAYSRVKDKYDPKGILGNLYDKCVMKK